MSKKPSGVGTIVEDEGRAHIMPMGDLREHEASPDCWCHPREEDDDLMVHHSLDGREGVENGITYLH